MKITLLTNRDLASHITLGRLIDGLTNHQLSIFISEKVGSDHSLPKPLMDLSGFEKELLNDGRPSFEQLAQRAGCQLQGFSDLGNQVNGAEGIARIAATAPDLIISVRFGLIIREQIIALPKYGIINLHSGVLPAYRGVMATFRAMQNQDREIGSTLHFIQDGGIDNGDIISIARIELALEKSYLLNVVKLYDQGCRQILAAVDVLASGQAIEAQPQQGRIGYYTFPQSDELDTFFAAGGRLFDRSELVALN
jgi:methionyl-tRNA formyltransferase